MRFNASKLGALSAAAVTVGALGILPGSAGAARWDASNDDACETSANVLGRGASFARSAHIGFGAQILAPDPFTQSTATGFGAAFAGGECSEFDASVRPPVRVVEYAPTGSGSGRAALGATNIANQRFTDGAGNALGFHVNFGGADEAPTAAQIANANAGDTGVAYDNAVAHTIPLVSSSIGVDARIPDGCSVTANANAGNRRISRTVLDQAFRGTVTRWSSIVSNISGTVTGTSTACRDAAFQVVVRLDSSGTTFQFKRYLADINSGDIDTVTAGTQTWNGIANTAWPSTVTVSRAASNGAGPQLDHANTFARTGALAYADLGTSRNREYGWGTSTNDSRDVRFWLYVERRDGSYRSPALDDDQVGPSPTGANCLSVEYNDFAQESDPINNGAVLPASTTDSWFDVSAVSTTSDYPICALSYAMAFEDAQPVNAGINRNAGSTTTPITQAQQRTTKDYLWYAVEASCGQTTLGAIDYAPLTTAPDRNGDDVLSRAQAAVQAITWPTGSLTERPLPAF
jgi:ABC-type phosphate transport system substrate-binding protein